MALYGVTVYGTETYGLDAPPAYLCANFSAQSTGYDRILVTWNQPTSGEIFRYRLLTSRYGYPVNENDGTVVMDTGSATPLTVSGYPGSSYLDLQVIPGTMHYYGMYVQVDADPVTWMRSGITACLATADFGSTDWMYSLIPEWFRALPNGEALPVDANGKSDLYKFVDVMGWGLNTLRTQYDMLDRHLNDPLAIQPADLWNMAAELGITFSAEIEASTVRKAVANWATVCQERGTLLGIRNEINLRTGWGADVQIGQNILLEDDQAQFLSPIFFPYIPTQTYNLGECVWRLPTYYSGEWPLGYWSTQPFSGQGYWYKCLIQGTRGIDPPTNGTSNANWGVILDGDDFLHTLNNVQTDNPSTWEMLDASASLATAIANPLASTSTSGAPPITSGTTLTQGLGVQTPGAVSTSKAWNSLRAYNRHGSASSFYLRSVSRKHGLVGQIPDPSFEAGYTVADQVAERSTNSAGWVPDNWPSVLTNIGDDQDYARQISVPAYWTAVGATIDLSMLHPHTGAWSAVINTDINAPPGTFQFPDPGFDIGVAGWEAFNCTIQESAVGGNPCAMIVPDIQANPYVQSPQITVTPGTALTVTAQLQGPVAVSMKLELNWYDVNSNELSVTSGTASSNATTAWGTYSVSATVPATAATMALIVSYVGTPAAITDIIYVNNLVVSYPGLVDIASVSSPWVKCPAGTTCTGTLWAYAPTALDTTIRAQLQWFDNHGNQLAPNNGTAALPTAATWVSYTATGTAPTGAVYVALALVYTTPQSADTVYLDDTTLAAGLNYNAQYPPEQIQAIQDGLPVPWVMDTQIWNPLTEYATNDVVLWEGQSFTALRASTGAIPPHNNVATPEWAPLSYDRRIRLMVSGMTSQNMTASGNQTANVIPFVEWFDAWGKFLARVFARNPNSGGAEARPDQLAFDSFTTPSATYQGTIPITSWAASFYNNTTLTGSPVLTRTDPAVDFTWYSTSPGAGVNATNWSAKWIGTFTAPATGVYTFGISSSDGSKVIVNGTTVVSNWATQENTYQSGTISLTSGATITVEVDYFKGAIASENTTYPLWVDPDLWDDGFPIWWDGLGDYGEMPYGLGWGCPFNDFYARTRVFPCEPGATVVANIPCLFQGPGALYLHWYDADGHTLGSTEGELWGGWYQQFTPLTVTDVAPPGTAYVVIGSMLQFYFGIQELGEPYQNFILGDFTREGIISISPVNTNDNANPALVGVVIREAGGTEELIRYAYPREEFLPWCWIGQGEVIIEDVVWSGLDFTNPVPWLSQTGGPNMNGRYTDDRQYTWNVADGAFLTGGYAGGSAWPANPATRSVALLTGTANCQVGVTFRTAPNATQGLVFRYSNDTNYWRADRTALKKNVAGTWTTVGTYTTTIDSEPAPIIFNTNDRIVANLNGSTITIYRNGISVLTVTDAFNDTATQHGIETE